MADSISAIINKEDLQSASDWNTLLSSNGIDVSISEKLVSNDHVGYISCLFEGKKTGFEYEIEDINIEEYPKKYHTQINAFDSVVTLTLRDGIKSALSACAIASAIIQKDGVIIESENTLIFKEDAFAWAQKNITGFKISEIERAKAKKELRKLKRSEEEIRNKLVNSINSVKGFNLGEGLTAGVYIGLIFEQDDVKASVTSNSWVFSSTKETIQKSSELLLHKSANEEKCEQFYKCMERCLDGAYLHSLELTNNNLLIIRFSNDYMLECSPEESLSFNKGFFRFSINQKTIDVSI